MRGEPQAAAWQTRPNEGLSAAAALHNFSTPSSLPVGIPHSLKRGRKEAQIYIFEKEEEDGCGQRIDVILSHSHIPHTKENLASFSSSRVYFVKLRV